MWLFILLVSRARMRRAFPLFHPVVLQHWVKAFSPPAQTSLRRASEGVLTLACPGTNPLATYSDKQNQDPFPFEPVRQLSPRSPYCHPEFERIHLLPKPGCLDSFNQTLREESTKRRLCNFIMASLPSAFKTKHGLSLFKEGPTP